MKCQILFSGKNKKNIINLSSAENAQRVIKVIAVSLLASVAQLDESSDWRPGGHGFKPRRG